MKRHSSFILLMLTLFICFGSKTALAADNDVYTVKPGDSLWKISVKYQIGLSEIIQSNPQYKDPSMIYPGDKVTVPLLTATKSVEEEVVALVNKERASRGLKPLTHNWQLSRVARYKSEDMRDRNYFSHTSPTYGSPFDMMKAFNVKYSTAGENIAKGQKTAQSVMTAWMNSAGHRENILKTTFTEIGVGYATDAKGNTYWTQMFIKP